MVNNVEVKSTLQETLKERIDEAFVIFKDKPEELLSIIKTRLNDFALGIARTNGVEPKPCHYCGATGDEPCDKWCESWSNPDPVDEVSKTGISDVYAAINDIVEERVAAFTKLWGQKPTEEETYRICIVAAYDTDYVDDYEEDTGIEDNTVETDNLAAEDTDANTNRADLEVVSDNAATDEPPEPVCNCDRSYEYCGLCSEVVDDPTNPEIPLEGQALEQHRTYLRMRGGKTPANSGDKQ